MTSILSLPLAGESVARPPDQPYGDPTELNTCRVVLEAVGKEVLGDIVLDYLQVLETSAAIYEKNGDYACGIFSSGWCRKMDAASRARCGTADNRAALDGGQWHCHESCWNTSRTSMATNQPTDLPCHGGIRIYAVPIRANGEVVGAINFGYGDPPTDPAKLQEIADRYGLPVEELRQLAASYPPRPPSAVELARSRLATAAKLIGTMIERKLSQDELKSKTTELERFNRLAVGRELRILELKRQLNELSQALGKPAPYDLSFASGKTKA